METNCQGLQYTFTLITKGGHKQIIADRWYCKTKEVVIYQAIGMAAGVRLKYRNFKIVATESDSGKITAQYSYEGNG